MARRASNEEVNALRQEQRDEVESTMVGAGNVGPFTKGMNRGMSVWIPISTIVGALLGLVVGLLLGGGGWLIVALVAGAVAGMTFGFSAGGFVGSRRRGEGDARLDDPSSVRRTTAPQPDPVATHGGGPPEAPSSDEARKLVKE
jgi:hypothetical protein